MSESLTDFAARVARYHRVPTGIVASVDQTQAIHSATRTYSTRAPLSRTVALTASANNEWTLTTAVSGWADGYSVTGILYEWGEGNLIPLDPNEWRVIRRGSADYLRAIELPCNATGIWLEYTRPHVVGVTPGDTTIPQQDLDAVAKLAAAECCYQASAAAADEKGSTINANVVDYGGIAPNWTTRAEKLEAAYAKHMADRYPVSGAIAEWDGATAYGRRAMWHNSRRF